MSPYQHVSSQKTVTLSFCFSTTIQQNNPEYVTVYQYGKVESQVGSDSSFLVNEGREEAWEERLQHVL